jgi:hypothetical protein
MLLLLVAGLALSTEGLAETGELPEASVVWGEVLRQREQLTSGVYHVRGTYATGVTERLEVGESDKLEIGNVSCFGAFDFSASKIRFDRTFPSWTFDRRMRREMAIRGQQNNPLPAIVTLVSGTAPEYSFHYLSASKSMELHQPEVRRPPNRLVGGSWMDARGLGIFHSDQNFVGMTLKEIIDRRSAASDTIVRLSEEGLYELTYLHNDITEYRFWIDPKRGHTVVRFSAKHGGPELGRESYDIPYLERHVEWEEVGGTWVPVAYRCTAFRAMPKNASSDEPDIVARHTYRLVRHEWKVEWESVNQPVPDVLFDYDVLPLDHGTKVVDRRREQPFLLKVVGDPDYPSLGPIPQITPENEGRAVEQPRPKP